MAPTSGGAWAEFAEDRKGRLAPGLLADVVVLSQNLSTLSPEALGEVQAMTTICDGRVVFQRG